MLLAFSAPAIAKVSPDLFALGLEALGDIEVYSPAKELRKVSEAPAIVTVITGSEIRGRGLKSLKEVLDRVPGFLTTPDESTYLISNRGFAQNPNSNYLLLLDGQPLNNQSNEGAEEYMLFPSLFQIQRVEVIRGPGSTLWGSDAGMGVINLVTYNAQSLLEGLAEQYVEVNFDYVAKTRRHIANLQMARRLGPEADVLVSITTGRSRAAWTDIYDLGDSGPELSVNQDAYLSYEPSYEVQAVARFGGWRLTGRTFRFRHSDTAGTSSRVPGYPGLKVLTSKDTDNWFLRVDNTATFGESWHLESAVAHASYRIRRDENILRLLPRLVVNRTDRLYTDQSVDLRLRHRTGSHNLMAGLQYIKRDFSRPIPLTQLELDATGQWVVLSQVDRDLLRGIEETYGLFFEDEYRGIDHWLLTAGVRFDKNTLRLPGQAAYPRFAAVYNANDNLTFKYTYNRGYVRPTIERSDGTIDRPLIRNGSAFVGPERPQTSISNDVQVTYSKQDLTLAASFYSYKIADYIARVGYDSSQLYQGLPIRYQNQNVGEIGGRGVELELSYQLARHLRIYGNAAFAKARFRELEVAAAGGAISFNIVTDTTFATPDGNTTGVPQRLWNAGLDWNFSDKAFANLHYRGWANSWGKTSNDPAFSRYGPEHFVDFSFGFSPGITPRTSRAPSTILSFYGKNVFANRANYPQGPHGGYIVEQGRELGIQVTWSLSQ